MPQISVPDDPDKGDPLKVDLAIVARDLKLPPEKIEKTVDLLDQGNTIPFITRFRKDLTGGLNEQQILAIKQRVAQLRALAERKTFVLKSIESQGKLTDELRTQINKSSTSRRLEDLYLPFKPKKQSRASLARQQGLEPLADDIFSGGSPDIDLATRSTEFVRVDKGLTSVDEVIKGVGDLLAERFSENDELRSTLRKIMWNDGKLESQLIATENPDEQTATSEAAAKKQAAPSGQTAETTEKPETANVSQSANLPAADPPTNSGAAPLVEQKQAVAEQTPEPESGQASQPEAGEPAPVDQQKPESGSGEGNVQRPSETTTGDVSVETSQTPPDEPKTDPSMAAMPPTEPSVEAQTSASNSANDSPDEAQKTTRVETGQPDQSVDQPASPPSPTTGLKESAESEKPVASETAAASPATEMPGDANVGPESSAIKETTGKGGSAPNPPSVSADASSAVEKAKTPEPASTVAKPKKKKKKKKKKKVEDPFNDYRDFKQPLKQIPNHRILAINRGERAGKLKVKIKVDGDKLTEAAFAALIPQDHPSTEFLQKCANDALARFMIPSLEREIRRELTEAAEKHAVEVFANNLRNLLLQPPIRNRVVLAIDPGFKRGCSVAVLDACGNLLDSGHTFVVGNQNRRDESKQKIAEWVKKYNVDVIAIGNGAACRQTEQMVSDVIGEQLSDHQVRYVMVNEAGASIYSTSEIGREELPDAAPSIRSAASIGRRLQDPLSELVKISPANIGVGMYQHDVKAKHLSESLDDVVEFCVNRVGVNVNTASPSLLKYVSGLNALTARRVVEFRQSNGQFKNRDELKQVSGVGDATFVQAAGFLRIHGGSCPLDCTSIHPESYEIANDVLSRVGTSVEELFPEDLIHPPEPPTPPSSLAQPAAAAAVIANSSDESAEVPKPDSEVPKPDSEVPKPDSSESVTPGSSTTVDASTSTAEAKIPSADPAESSAPESTPDSTLKVADSEAVPNPAVPNPAVPNPAVPNPAVPNPAVSNAAEPNLANNSTSENAVARESFAPDVEPAAVVDAPSSESAAPSETPAATAPEGVGVSAVPENPIDKQQKEALIAKRKEILKKISDLDAKKLASEHASGVLMVKDILMALKRPKWDPRDKIAKPIFRRGIIKADDLKPEMQLDAQVVNVVDFGVFVDIGLGESSLVHVSQLSSHFIRDPHRLYAVGDVLKVWVSEVDNERRRVKLTAIRPGAKKPQGRRKTSETERPRGKPSAKFGNKYSGRPKGKRGAHSSFNKNTTRRDHARKSKPKPVKPITEGMLKGKEPMRSFSDLAQFVSGKPADEKEAKKKDDPKS